jgi:hypothetical protein
LQKIYFLIAFGYLKKKSHLCSIKSEQMAAKKEKTVKPKKTPVEDLGE